MGSQDYIHIFFRVCTKGHLDVAQWLFSLSKNYDTKTVITLFYKGFKSSSRNGQLHVAKWLYSISKIDGNKKIKPNEYVNDAFKNASNNNKLETVKWLCSTNLKYKIYYENNRLRFYKIIEKIPLELTQKISYTLCGCAKTIIKPSQFRYYLKTTYKDMNYFIF